MIWEPIVDIDTAWEEITKLRRIVVDGNGQKPLTTRMTEVEGKMEEITALRTDVKKLMGIVLGALLAMLGTVGADFFIRILHSTK